MSDILFFVFGELIGMIVRFIFVYHFNLNKMKKAYKENHSSESSKNNMATIIFIVAVVILLTITRFL